jgi:hypothetical protein
MKSGLMKNVLFVDSIKTTTTDKQIQKSIDKVVEKGNYERVIFRTEDNGNIK